MNDLQTLTESFKTKYESFITGCDSIELDEKWDKEANGEMDVYYENELISVILSLIAADREISGAEVRALNENFGFSCTAETLRLIYENCGEEIESYFDLRFVEGYETLRQISGKLADAYRELFDLICDIIAESDGAISDAELEKLAHYKSRLR